MPGWRARRLQDPQADLRVLEMFFDGDDAHSGCSLARPTSARLDRAPGSRSVPGEPATVKARACKLHSLAGRGCFCV